MDFSEVAEVFGVSEVYNEATGMYEPVSAEEPVFAVTRAFNMGWNWAMFLCHNFLTQAMINSALRGPEMAERHLLLDKRRSPKPSEDHPVLGPYVDNGNYYGLSAGVVNMFLRALMDHLDLIGVTGAA